MGFLREIGINTGWIRPRPGEFLPEHQELGLAYQLLDLTFRDSRKELERHPEDEDMVRDLMGKRIRERALRVTSAALKASYYEPGIPGIQEIPIATGYMFRFASQKLVVLPAPGLKIPTENLDEAKPRVWFEHGKKVVDETLNHLAAYRGLPAYLARIEVPR